MRSARPFALEIRPHRHVHTFEFDMSLTDLLTPEAIIPALRVNGKKQALQEMSERAALASGLTAREIFDSLLQRERLGSTGVGDGIAIPHGKLAKCTRIFGIFARLERPIDFEALDGFPVDLIFLLVAPEGAGADHLKALAMIARLLRDPNLAAQLRATRDASALYSLLTLTPTSNAA
jgi:PTS system nitrogen regulatory IIA component